MVFSHSSVDSLNFTPLDFEKNVPPTPGDDPLSSTVWNTTMAVPYFRVRLDQLFAVVRELQDIVLIYIVVSFPQLTPSYLVK